MDVVSIFSLIASCLSIALAIFAIFLGRQSEKESQENHTSSQRVLAEVDKRAAVIEKTVTDSQQQLLNTMLSLLNRAVPREQTQEEMMGMQAMQMIMETYARNPAAGNQMADMLKTLVDAGNANNEEAPQQNSKS